jgi:two-component system, CitB family, sensor kinase
MSVALINRVLLRFSHFVQLVLLVLLVLLTGRDLQRQVRTLLHFTNQQKQDHGMRTRVRRPQRLSTQVVIMMVAILVVTLGAGFAVVQTNLNRQLNTQYEHRALAVAQALAAQPGLQQAVLAGDPGGVGPHGTVQAMAMAAATAAGAAFVVVTNRDGIRYSHPKSWLIGTPVGYPDREPASTEPFRTGTPWMGDQHGTLGMEATGKAPMFSHGQLIGEVSVGFLTTTVAGEVASTLLDMAPYFLAVLALGVLAALALSRRLKRQTFGLELGEIAALLQEREAMLHGIREGVLGYDKNERIVLANDFARQLLALPPDFVGRPLAQVLPPGRLADVVTGAIEGSDLLVLHGDRVLAANRMPIWHERRRQLGWVITFQDRTESETLKRQLDDAMGLTETLRAQSHEFANRLHTLVGLVELGHYDEAIEFVTEVSAARADLTERLQNRIPDAKLVALILAKVSLADERDVQLRVMDDSHLDGPVSDVSEVLTVVGNLIDNAIDAAATGARPRWVELTVVAAEHDLLIRVRDSGPGVPSDMREAIFMDGVTTKSSATGARRGLGLALVRQVVTGRGGMISVGHDDGAVFTAVLPMCVGAAQEVGTAVPP